MSVQSYSDVYVHDLQRTLDETRQVNRTLLKQRDEAVAALRLTLDWLANDCPDVKGYQAARLGKLNEAIASALSSPTPGEVK